MALLTSYGLLFIFFISSSIATTPACRKIDQDSLWSSFDIDSSSLNWSSNDCCRWEGITCDMFGRVTHLLLPSKGIKGCISHSLGNLTHLSHLNLSHNLLSGPLEAGFFSSLTRLQILDLSKNQLSGKLPSSLSSSYIRMVDLSSNQFNGTIPSSFLQHAWNLSSLNVSNNHFTGQIPSSICLLSSLLKVLDFSHNIFSGSIPLGLGNCSELEVFRAGDNTLSGSLPADIYNAQALQEISLSTNNLFGPIGENIANLTNLRILDLSFNQLSGMLPLHIGKLSKLKLMFLHRNSLEGPIPPSLLNCTNLVELNLGFNHLNGNISALDFSKLTLLSKLDFMNNSFYGIMPISIYSCKSLKALRLSMNDLEGQLQPQILSLESLSFLSLSYNRLTNVTGALKILMGCKSLRVLLLSSNFLGEAMPNNDIMLYSGFQNLRVFGISSSQLTGEVPVWLSKLKKLELLGLSFNKLTGSIPGWLGALPRLSILLLHDNLFSGEFPKELCRLQALVSQKAATQTALCYLELTVYDPQIDASLTASQYNTLCNLPRAISLRNNFLSGNIPLEIGQLQLLQRLDIGVNNFSGSIPNQISNLTNLERLDLSRNRLSGEIPASLSSLHFLSSFSVAYNNLQGQIPSGTQIQGFNATEFQGNPGLCGAPLPNKCQEMDTSNASNDIEDVHSGEGKGVPWFHFSVIFGFIFGFWGICGPLAFSRSWRNSYFLFLSNVKDKLLG